MPHPSDKSLRPSNSSSRAPYNGSSNETGSLQEDPVLLSASMIVLLSFICLFIVVANGLVIFLICRKRALRSLTNMFLTSLAISDLITSLVGLPLLFFCLKTNIINICVSSTIFFRFTAMSSVCHVILVAFDRYVAIVHTLRQDSIVTTWRAIGAITFVWLFSFAASVIQLSWYGLDESSLSDYDETEDFDVMYTKACIVLFFAVPLVLMCYMYGHIFYISVKVTKSDRQMTGALQKESRSAFHEWRGRSVLLIMVVIFAGCWLPFFLAMLVDHTESSQMSRPLIWLQRLFAVLGFIPPLLNPLLCTLTKKDFRQALREVIFKRKYPRQYQKRVYHQRFSTEV